MPKWRLLDDCQGVTTTEYALVIICIAMVMTGIDQLMLPAVHTYLKRIILIVSLPIP
jgi:Flp pilus assembly pilin Flp